MRPTRAYLAGVGTAGSLLAGAAILFVLAGALLAVHGWPEITAAGAPSAVVVPAAPAPRHVALARSVLVAFQMTAPDGRGGAPARGGAAGGQRSAGPRKGHSVGDVGTPPVPGGSGAGGARGHSSPPGRTTTPGTGTSPGPVTIPSTPTHSLEATVTSTEKAVGATVSSLGAAVGKTVTGLSGVGTPVQGLDGVPGGSGS